MDRKFLRGDSLLKPGIFGLPDPELFSTDPDPTCNNGNIKFWLLKAAQLVPNPFHIV